MQLNRICLFRFVEITIKNERISHCLNKFMTWTKLQRRITHYSLQSLTQEHV